MPEAALVSIVDDDESVRDALPDLLKGFGFAVQSFASAEEFLASGRVDETPCRRGHLGLLRGELQQIGVQLVLVESSQPVRCAFVDLEYGALDHFR